MSSAGWRLDKSVPLPLIGVLVLQIASFGWIASKLDSRLSDLERYRTAQEDAEKSTALTSASNDRELLSRMGGIEVHQAAIDVKVDNIKEGVSELRDSMKRVENRK